MKIRKPKDTLKEYRKKNYKHKKTLSDFTEKQYTDYQVHRSKIFGYRKQQTKIKNQKIRYIKKHYVTEEIIEKRIEQTKDRHYKNIEKFYNPLRFTGIDKKFEYSEKLIWEIGKKYIAETNDFLNQKKIKEVVKFINKKGIGGYIHIVLNYIDLLGNDRGYSDTSYPHQEIDLEYINSMINFMDESLIDNIDIDNYPVDIEEQIIYLLNYTTPNKKE